MYIDIDIDSKQKHCVDGWDIVSDEERKTPIQGVALTSWIDKVKR